MQLHDVKTEITSIYEYIEIRRKEARINGVLYGQLQDERVAFEYVDLGDVYDRLIKVIPEIEYYYNSLIRFSSLYGDVSLHKKANTVYLAAICEMIKQEYNGGTHKTYIYVTGANSSNKYYKILENAFETEGILPENWNQKSKISSFRYNDVLIHESGIPPKLVNNIIRFFLVFWKYFKNTPRQERENFLLKLSSDDDLSGYFTFHLKDKSDMLELYKEIKDYPSKVNQVISRLEEISNCIEDQVFDYNLSFDDLYKDICAKLKYDIFSVLPRNAKSLLTDLYKIFINRVTSTKFKRIIGNYPPNTCISLPNGVISTVKHYSKVVYGKHKVLDVTYEVVPDISIGLNELTGMPRREVIFLDSNRFIYISRDYFDVRYADEICEPAKIITDNFQGFIWFGLRPKGFPIEIDGLRVEPEQEIYWNLNISYDYSYEQKTYRLIAYIPILRVYKNEFCNKRVIVQCEQSQTAIYRYVDRNGYLATEAIAFPLSEINSGLINVNIFIDDKMIDNKSIVLEDSYVFERTTKEQLVKTRAIQTTGQLLIFTLYNCELIFTSNVTKRQYTKYLFLDYHVHRLSLNSSNDNFELIINKGVWSFLKIVEIYLVREDDDLYDETGNNNNVFSLNEFRMKLICSGITADDYEKIFIFVEKDTNIWRFGFNEIALISNGNISINTSYISKHVMNVDNAVGMWYFSVYFNSKKLNTLSFNVIPKICVNPLKNIYMEGEIVTVELNSDFPVFYSNVNEISCCKVIQMGTARVISSEDFEGDTLISYIGLAGLDIEQRIEFKPKIWGVRLIDTQNNKIKTNRIDLTNRKDIDNSAVSLFSEEEVELELIINNEKQRSVICKNRIIVSLSEYQQLFKEVNSIKIVKDGQACEIRVIWHPAISFINVTEQLDSQEVRYKYFGPSNILYYVMIADEYNNKLYETEYKTCTTNGEDELIIILRKADAFPELIYINILSYNFEECDKREIKICFANMTGLFKDIVISKRKFVEEVRSIDSAQNDRNSLKYDIIRLLKAAEEYSQKELLLGE